ncbi:hypothetical protein GGR50DRAFT_674807 [Xylaria sp. CBS 124048]|nr:hypothetical protein GGR50DRAFT_674807 [Xylaria sp. CBS 124048]
MLAKGKSTSSSVPQRSPLSTGKYRPQAHLKPAPSWPCTLDCASLLRESMWVRKTFSFGPDTTWAFDHSGLINSRLSSFLSSTPQNPESRRRRLSLTPDPSRALLLSPSILPGFFSASGASAPSGFQGIMKEHLDSNRVNFLIWRYAVTIPQFPSQTPISFHLASHHLHLISPRHDCQLFPPFILHALTIRARLVAAPLTRIFFCLIWPSRWGCWLDGCAVCCVLCCVLCAACCLLLVVRRRCVRVCGMRTELN